MSGSIANAQPAQLNMIKVHSIMKMRRFKIDPSFYNKAINIIFVSILQFFALQFLPAIFVQEPEH
jgi:hypothetical protein